MGPTKDPVPRDKSCHYTIINNFFSFDRNPLNFVGGCKTVL